MNPLQTPSAPDKTQLLSTILRLSHRYGGDEQHVIAGGGNTSCKTADTLWVKASGTDLATIKSEGFVALDRPALDRALDSDFGQETDLREKLYKDALMAARLNPETGLRPSVETLMHHMMPGRYVVHTHSNPVNQLTCCVGGKDLVEKLFGDRVLWISYVDPGYVLSKHIQKLLAGHRFPAGQPAVMMLENHGLVVAADDPDAIDRAMRNLMKEIEDYIDAQPESKVTVEAAHADPRQVDAFLMRLGGALSQAPRGLTIDSLNDATVATFLNRADARSFVLAGGPLTPDQIVYCKSFPLWLDVNASIAEIAGSIDRYEAEYGHSPKVILAPGAGLISAGSDARAAKIVQRVYLDAIKIMLGADRLGGVHFLSERDRKFIDNWEVEQFRRQVAAQGGQKAAS